MVFLALEPLSTQAFEVLLTCHVPNKVNSDSSGNVTRCCFCDVSIQSLLFKLHFLVYPHTFSNSDFIGLWWMVCIYICVMF